MTARLRTNRVAALAALIATTVLVVPAAEAQERGPGRNPERGARAMDEVKSRCLRQIDLRHTALAAVKGRLGQALFVTDDHEASLVQNLDVTAASLSRLADQIQTEDDFGELRAECASIVLDHRVFVLVLPRTRLVVASDAELSAARRLSEAGDKLQTKIDEAKAAGRNTAEAENDLTRMRGHIAVAVDNAGGVYGRVIGITATQFNANHQILEGPRQAARAAKDQLSEAVAAAREVRQDLGDG